MSEAKSSGVVFAYPVSDAELTLHDFVCNRITEFDESGGEVLWWRPMGPPSIAGPVYLALRSAKLEERDREHTEEYHRRCREGGGERRYLQGAYCAAAQRLDVPDDLRPAIVFSIDDSPDSRIVLPIAPGALGDMERRRSLACFLHQELRAERIESFAGLGEAASPGLDDFTNYVAAMAKAIAGDIANGLGVPEGLWHSYCRSRGLIERVDPKVATIGEAEINDLGVIKFRTYTDGKMDGEVTFAGMGSTVSKQRQLMFVLLNARGGRVHLRTLVEAAYEIDVRTGFDDSFTASLHGKRLAQLIRDIRDKKLEKAGINPDVLPTLHSPHVKSGMMSLRLAHLTLRGFGGDDREMRTAARSGRRSSL